MALTFPGSPDFAQRGVPQYIFGGFDLDRLMIPFRGPRDQLDSFIAGLTAWEASAFDGDMFLSGYSVDGDKVFPTVQKIFTGKKGGVLTAGKHESDDAVLSATARQYPLTVQYYAPRNVLSWISRIKGTAGPSGACADPTGDIRVINFTIGDAQTFTTFPSVTDLLLSNYFSSTLIDTTRSEEIVAGEYWMNSQSKTKVLNPFTIGISTGVDFYVGLAFMLNSGETAGIDFIQLIDSGSGKVIGINFDGTNWVVYTDVGAGATISIVPTGTAIGVTHQATIHLHGNGDGTWTAAVEIAGDSGTLTGPAAMTIDTLRVGAMGTGTVDRIIGNSVKIGNFSGGADIFLGIILPIPNTPYYWQTATIVPPYNSTSGAVTPTVDSALSIKVVGTGADGYAQKDISSFNIG